MACGETYARVALLVCVLGRSQGDMDTAITKSLIGLYRDDYRAALPHAYIRDGQCDAFIDYKTLDVCFQLASSVTVVVADKLPPDIKIELSLGGRPRWAVKIYRKTHDCAGEANVTVTVTCQK